MIELNTNEVKNLQLSILDYVDKWCNDHKIKYYLAYGTLLGAIRHQGYIPWDDDIDIYMLRSDYEEFIKNFNSNTSKYKVLHPSIDKKYPYEFAKIQDTTTRLVEHTAWKYNMGINIDLFVLDNIPDIKNAESLYRKSRIYRNLLNFKFYSYSMDCNIIKRIAIYILRFIRLILPISKHYLTTKIDKISKYYQNENNTRYVGDICQRWFHISNLMEKSWFDNIIKIPFEGHSFNAPEKYHEILTASYGNYMKLPPEEEQVTHHTYTAYLL